MENRINKKSKKGKKVLIAMSGGVDSSVAAYLLAEEGYDTSGLTMYFNEFAEAHVQDAVKACSRLGINHTCVDLTEQIKEKVIAPFVKGYLLGTTPNPCIECNRFIKFGLLFDYAIKEGFDYFATGHYASVKKNGGNFGLFKAADLKKDQSYFLYAIKKDNLEKILFPLADYTKEEVKKIAYKNDIPAALKKESQEICFVKDNDYKRFVANHAWLLQSKLHYDNNALPADNGQEIKEEPVFNIPGSIKDINGNIIGQHEGISGFTIGQRKGIKISSSNALYVLEIDAISNTVTVGARQYLSKNRLTAGRLNFLVESIPERAMAKIRYKSSLAPCSIKIKNGKAEVIFDRGRDAITPGQSIVFYAGDMVLGGGIIENVF
ncbi:MAG: tRNA 2-thiouridine(34) synthase MnmA [Actinobacteria bacterium]|nr:tRNA 2-thiouridine(34) synthase MnmA [Actinomycetota bacterium]